MTELIVPVTAPAELNALENEFKLYNADEVKKSLSILRAMNHKLRCEILKIIDHSETINVTSLYKALNIEQSVASQHLAILRRAKIVNAKRISKQIMYSINKERLAKYVVLIKDMLV